MDIVKLCIPYRFLRVRVRLSWHDIHFGLVNQLLDPAAPIAFAADQVGELEAPSEALLGLARSEGNAQTLDLVARLVGTEPQVAEDEIRGKWL